MGNPMHEEAPLACNINAIPGNDQARYRDLMTRLRASIRGRTELPFGYSYTLTTESLSLPELADWVTLERLCCPFLNFLIEIDAAGVVHLTVRGPKGVKQVLEEEFPDHAWLRPFGY
jgi:hypothetical protein